MSEHYHNILKGDLFFDGKWVPGEEKKRLIVKQKYTQEKMMEISLASTDQVEKTIISAEKGFHTIRLWSAEKKKTYLVKLKELLLQKKESFAQLIMAEAGKPIELARSEVDRAITTLEISASETLRFCGEMIPIDYQHGIGKTAFTKRIPIGIVLGITPFNFPLNLVVHKIAPALAVGCSIVIKPAPQSPLTSLAFASLCEEAGFPPGAVNVIVTDNILSEKMVSDHRFSMVSFTGSAKVGWYLKTIIQKKKIILELGGNAAAIIDDSADFSLAASLIAKGSNAYAGQTCISTQRVYVHEKLFEPFLLRLKEATEQLEVGDPSLSSTIVGPMIDEYHFERIIHWVEEAVCGGAGIIIGGKTIDNAHHLYAPTFLENTKRDMKVVCEEVFGPVAIIEKVKNFSEAIEKSNDSAYGLQAGVFTQNIQNMKMAFSELEVAGVMINNIPGFRVDGMPYGGIKDSGFGREGPKYAMEEMSESKLLVW